MSQRSAFLKFLLVGAAAAGVNIGSRLLFNKFMPYELALLPAYVCGMTTAFVLNRRFVFTTAVGPAHAQAVRFLLVNMVALAQVWVVGVGLARLAFPWAGFTWHADTVAHVCAVISPTLTSYFAHKHFSFAESPTTGLAG